MDHDNILEFKISTKTNCPNLSAGLYREIMKDSKRPITLKAIGAGAVNQAVKALASLNSQLESHKTAALFHPTFDTVEFADAEKKYVVIKLNIIIVNVAR